MSRPERSFRLPPFFIKICGLTSEETLDAALNAGADMVGFVFHPKSPRHVTPERAAELAARARRKAEIVALIVNFEPEAARALAGVLRPDWLQLHGQETPEAIRATRAATGLRILKAAGVAAAVDLAALPPLAEAADLLLIDAKPPKDAAYPGGHGKPFDWTILNAFDPRTPFLLSGGLDPANVGAAIRAVRGLGVGLAGVDVSSGVKRAPGVKDVAKISAFVAAARAAL